MRKTRREFLSEIFQRELEIMINFYKGKKKAGKKTLVKLMAIKPHNLEKTLDDYFHKIARAFFKRQMIIWILLKHKYLATSKVGIKERRF